MVQNGKGVASHKISLILSNENDDALFDMIWYITISHKSVRKKKEKTLCGILFKKEENSLAYSNKFSFNYYNKKLLKL